MGRREEISKELDQLASEIEKEALPSRGEQAAKVVSARDTHIRLELVVTQHAPTSVQIRISTEPADDDRPS